MYDQETPFNMALMFYMSLRQLMDAKDVAAVNGEIYKWHQCLRAIYRNIKWKLNEEEVKYFDEKFTETKTTLSSNATNSSTFQKLLPYLLSDASILLDEIDTKIMVALDNHNMIFPKMENAGIESIYKDFKIGNPKKS